MEHRLKRLTYSVPLCAPVLNNLLSIELPRSGRFVIARSGMGLLGRSIDITPVVGRP
jgi:hypothetical protein